MESTDSLPGLNTAINVGWKFWLQWISASALGIIIGLVVMASLYMLHPSLAVPAGIIVWAIVGIMQWLVLHHKLSLSLWKWVLSSVIGYTIGLYLAPLLFVVGYLFVLITIVHRGVDAENFLFLVPIGALAGAIAGTTIGIAQWIVLRPQIANSKWWIPINAVGFSLGGILTVIWFQQETDFYRAMGLDKFSLFLLGVIGLSWFLSLSVIGLLLIWFLRSSLVKLKFSLISIASVIVLGLGISLFLLFGPIAPPANVEIIVDKSEDPRWWHLSPGGDKIVYESVISSKAVTVLLFLDTQQKQQIEKCSSFIWLDNVHLYCGYDRQVFILDTEGLVKIPLKRVEGQDMDLESILSEEKIIYKFEEDLNSLIVLDADYINNKGENYFVTVEDADTALQGHSYNTVVSNIFRGIHYVEGRDPQEKIYSPNSAYYYRYIGAMNGQQNLTIHSAATDEKLSEHTEEVAAFEVGGWAGDSSGVYFKTMPPLYNFFGPSKFPIRKLTVPPSAH